MLLLNSPLYEDRMKVKEKLDMCQKVRIVAAVALYLDWVLAVVKHAIDMFF